MWEPGSAPVAVLLITLNEGHNLVGLLENLRGWAQEIYLVDSYSSDETVSIALRYGVHVVQRKFRGFGDQWNFALAHFAVNAPWTMKMDPDERLTAKLKSSISTAVSRKEVQGISLYRRLWFMGRPLAIRQKILRVWRTGSCAFSGVSVNEHPIVPGKISLARGDMEHHDSPHLQHWLDKQNKYSSAEAEDFVDNAPLSAEPRLFGTPFERRMWLKRNFHHFPLRFTAVFLYYYVIRGLWRSGSTGYHWSMLRVFVFRLRELKVLEMKMRGLRSFDAVANQIGSPDNRVPQC